MSEQESPLQRHERLVAALREPDRFPWPVECVELLRTHISSVLLAGAFACKIKRPLDLGFLDFTSLAKRRHFCEEEVRLNRRLAPDTYLRTVPIAGSVDAPQLDGEGEPIEYAVLMRRFAQEALMDRRLQAGRLPLAVMDELADRIARFHAEAAAARPQDPYGRLEAVKGPVRRTLAQLRHLAGPAHAPLLEELGGFAGRALQEHTDRLEARRLEGRVRECHGDLHLANIAWEDGRLIVFDGIEFDPALRWIDVMNDVAFTVMDLDHRDAPAHRRRFLNRYLERSGDYEGLRLLPLFALYRALVRADIQALQARQADPASPERAAALGEAEAYLALARTYTLCRRPELAITCGVSGSGKTTAAARLVEGLGHIRLRSDVERKRLADLDAGTPEPADLYGPAMTQRTYGRLLELSRMLLEGGWSVVVDATFLKREQRRPFQRLAERLGCSFRILHVVADAERIRERILARRAAGSDASDATVELMRRQLEALEPLDATERPAAQRVRT